MIVLLYTTLLICSVVSAQADPTYPPSLGPSASPSPSPTPFSSRAFRGTSKSSKSKGEGKVSAELLDNEVTDQLEGPSPSTIPNSATAWSSLPPAGSGIHMSPDASTTNTLPPSPKMPPSAPPTFQPTFTDTPSAAPSSQPSNQPSQFPSLAPSLSMTPSDMPSDAPSDSPSSKPSGTPSIIPSLSPSMSVAPSDVPSSIPIGSATESCNLVASVDCRLDDGSPCSSLSLIPGNDTVNCTNDPYEIKWLYTAGSCNESTAGSESFECRDDNGGPRSVFMAYLTITGLTSNKEYVSKFIFQGINGFPVQSFIVSNESNAPLDESVKVVVSKGSPEGEILQEMAVSIACENLTIGDTFGALQLSSYRSNETSSSSDAFVPTTWIYSAKNSGNTPSVLKSISTGINGASTTIIPDVELLPGGEYHVVSHETISLMHSTIVKGEVAIVEETECFATSHYIITL